MKRYFIGFFAAYAVSVAAFVAMLLISLANWMFSDTPLWFDMLCLFAVTVPVIAVGELFGRRTEKTRQDDIMRHGLPILMLVMTAASFLGAPLADSGGLQILLLPGMLTGSTLNEMVPLDGYWDGLFNLIGSLLIPLLYHMGWCWGSTD